MLKQEFLNSDEILWNRLQLKLAKNF